MTQQTTPRKTGEMIATEAARQCTSLILQHEEAGWDKCSPIILRAISDAVKGSGAVEALDDLLHHGCLISDNGKRHNADPEKAVAALTALNALTLPAHPSTP